MNIKTKVKDLVHSFELADQIFQDCKKLVLIGAFSVDESTEFDYSETTPQAKEFADKLFRNCLLGYDSLTKGFDWDRVLKIIEEAK